MPTPVITAWVWVSWPEQLAGLVVGVEDQLEELVVEEQRDDRADDQVERERMTRARSSRKWSPSDIRPPSPMGSRGRPRNSSRTPPTDTAVRAPASGGAGRAGVVGVGRVCARSRPPRGSARRSGAARGSWSVVVVVVDQALGLGLEDPQGTTAAAGQLGQLLRAEEQHEDADDDQQLGRAESGDERDDEQRGSCRSCYAVVLSRTAGDGLRCTARRAPASPAPCARPRRAARPAPPRSTAGRQPQGQPHQPARVADPQA